MVGGLVRMDNPSVASCSVIGQPTTPQTSGALKLGSPSTRMCNVSSYWPHWFECSTTASNAEPHGGISPSAGSTSYAAPSPRASSAASRLCSAFCAATLTPDSEKKGCELSCLSPSAGDGSLPPRRSQSPGEPDNRCDCAVEAIEAVSSSPAAARVRRFSVRSRSRSRARIAAAIEAVRLNVLASGGIASSGPSAGAAKAAAAAWYVVDTAEWLVISSIRVVASKIGTRRPKSSVGGGAPAVTGGAWGAAGGGSTSARGSSGWSTSQDSIRPLMVRSTRRPMGTPPWILHPSSMDLAPGLYAATRSSSCFSSLGLSVPELGSTETSKSGSCGRRNSKSVAQCVRFVSESSRRSGTLT
eukprot:scaffold4031_cov101-Isochrysis_galbana.AAC.4